MILTTHIVTAGALVSALHIADPLLAFSICVGSHYILDAVPHWEYDLASIGKRREKAESRTLTINKRTMAADLSRIALDGIIGFALLLFSSPLGLMNVLSPLFLSIVIGSTLPDILQPLGLLIKKPPFSTVHDIGQAIHSKKFLPALPWGIATQASLIGASILTLLVV